MRKMKVKEIIKRSQASSAWAKNHLALFQGWEWEVEVDPVVEVVTLTRLNHWGEPDIERISAQDAKIHIVPR